MLHICKATGERQTSISGRAHVLCLVMFAFAASAGAIADEMPFWGGEPPDTNRVCSSSAAYSLSSFDTRICSSRRFWLEDFDSLKFGLLLLVR